MVEFACTSFKPELLFAAGSQEIVSAYPTAIIRTLFHEEIIVNLKTVKHGNDFDTGRDRNKVMGN
jgi:hypothetical protein